MERYSEYKDSGVKWLGQIPSHWEILPGLAVFKENKEKNTNLVVNTVLSLSYGEIIIKKDIDEGLVPADYNTYQIVLPGYIIIRCTDLQNDKVSLRTGFVKDKGIITGAYLGLITNSKNSPSYIHYFLHAWDITKEIYRHGSGLRQSLSWLDLRRLPILIPSKKEQEAIANYLDATTSKIDAAIAQQQKMIDLLNERKRIIINNAVTKGLDPNVKMKPSGIDWIGDIPENWDVMKLKHFVEVSDGTHDTPIYVEPSSNTYPLVTSRCIDNGEIKTNLANHITEYDYRIISNRSYVNMYDVIMPMIGTIGNPAIVLTSDKFAIKNVALFRTKGNYLIAKLLVYLLNSNFVSEQMSLLNKGGVQNFVSQDIIKNLVLIIPNNIEIVVSYLDKIQSQIENAKSKITQRISLLQERKQIIINDVVTGKVKVV